jgi:hypothetical protein
VVVLVVAIFALRHPRGSVTDAGTDTRAPSSAASHPVTPPRTPSTARAHRSASSSAPSRSVSSSSGTAAAAARRLPLVVLNNTTTVGLAAQAERTFETGGWAVTQIGNLQNSIVSTCAYFDPSVSGARASAQRLERQFPAIKRVQPKFPELPAGPIVVVLAPDYSAG